MSEFVPGQRWINSAQPELGLGTVIEVSHRTVTIAFVAIEETRVYSIQDTPLSRVVFKPGDSIVDQNQQQWNVISVQEQDALYIYHVEGIDKKQNQLLEHQLDHSIQLVRPSERLFSYQIDKNQWFELRYKAITHSSQFNHSEVFGLSGSRTSLLPHQLYIAHEVGKRFNPRVLLADEVGLGKTIEAGMILQQQLLRGLIKRVLIIVPEPLLHQWLVEMLRKFNLQFSLFDHDRFADALESEPESNPFHAMQLVLCSLDFATSDDLHKSALLKGEWDCLVIDEAHHLQWDESHSSDEYAFIESLTKIIPSVLLLTATPEQLGKESHFARLRLLDNNRFSNFQKFLEEENAYQPIAEIIELLLDEKPLTSDHFKILLSVSALDEYSFTNNTDLQNIDTDTRHKMITHLLDQQGTGRLLFRNTRASVGGFPKRNIVPYELESPDDYTADDLSSPNPEHQKKNWCEYDPRVQWLIDFIKQHKNQKILFITAYANTAMELSEYIRVKTGMHIPVFHEAMSIIERDRAAAFFADSDDGAQILLCSEIGGEGRNFQFARHLILFDLPVNPDLLEQRIGRIDRIGQGDEIFIHIPILKGSAQSVLFEIYFDGLQALQAPCPAAAAIYREYKSVINQSLQQTAIEQSTLNDIKEKTSIINEELHDGRDKLLELNSFKRDVAEKLIGQLDNKNDKTNLNDYMMSVFDSYGVDCEVHGENSYVLHPAETMVEVFPGLPDEGVTITFDRDTALKYETMQFLSWEHDMVVSITDSILINERGNTAVVTFSHSSVKEGLLLLECLFTLDVTQKVKPYLTSNLIRTVIGEDVRDYSKVLTPEKINDSKEFVKLELAKQIVKAKHTELEKLISISQKFANQKSSEIVETSRENIDKILLSEIDRLKSLARINPNVRSEEIDHFSGLYEDACTNLSTAKLRLDSLRVLVAT